MNTDACALHFTNINLPFKGHLLGFFVKFHSLRNFPLRNFPSSILANLQLFSMPMPLGDGFEEVNEFEENEWAEDRDLEEEKENFSSSNLDTSDDNTSSEEADDVETPDFNDHVEHAEPEEESPFPADSVRSNFQEENIQSLIDEEALNNEDDYFSNDF